MARRNPKTPPPNPKRFTAVLNLRLSPLTRMMLDAVASQSGRSTGELAREILERWAEGVGRE